jgi:hypothetical protein
MRTILVTSAWALPTSWTGSALSTFGSPLVGVCVESQVGRPEQTIAKAAPNVDAYDDASVLTLLGP